MVETAFGAAALSATHLRRVLVPPALSSTAMVAVLGSSFWRRAAGVIFFFVDQTSLVLFILIPTYKGRVMADGGGIFQFWNKKKSARVY